MHWTVKDPCKQCGSAYVVPCRWLCGAKFHSCEDKAMIDDELIHAAICPEKAKFHGLRIIKGGKR